MDKKIIVGIIVGIVALAGYLLYTSGPTVSAQGFYSVDAEPDIVSIYVSIEGRDADLQKAKDKHDKISDKVISELKKLGFLDSEIELQNYNAYPEYDWRDGEQRQKGYVVSSQITVKPKDFKKVIDVVDAAIDSGALVSYINFELSDEKQREYKKQTLEGASADAKSKAKSTAAGLGKNLGALVSVKSEEFYYPGPIPIYTRAEGVAVADDGAEVKEAALNLAPRKIEVSSNVVVEYRLRVI